MRKWRKVFLTAIQTLITHTEEQSGDCRTTTGEWKSIHRGGHEERPVHAPTFILEVSRHLRRWRRALDTGPPEDEHTQRCPPWKHRHRWTAPSLIFWHFHSSIQNIFLIMKCWLQILHAHHSMRHSAAPPRKQYYIWCGVSLSVQQLYSHIYWWFYTFTLL